jgi:uncharacterized protein (DUF1800 family)
MEPARPAAAGLDPYVPSASEPWDAIHAAHLLRRTTYHPRQSDITAILALTPSLAVDLLLDTPHLPPDAPIADNVTESLDGLDITLRSQVEGMWMADAATLASWQTETMRDAPLTIAEKMTAFWSNHFAVEFASQDAWVIAPLLFRQNRLFRETGLGSFRELMVNVTLDGAMLVYLGGSRNNVGVPNENYAREMLELYTTGLGHYTEGDIHEAARILTGWRVAQFSDEPAPNGIFNTYFLPAAHDIDAKQFMGVSFPARDASTNTEFIVRRDEVRRLIETIFLKRPDAIAEFICRKLYRFFVYSSPTGGDNAVIAAMAKLMVERNFEIKPVVAALLKSQHFFDNANLGSQIKTPLEFEIGLARQLGMRRDYAADTRRMGQHLFQPPNVGGWPGWHDWITTTSFPVRAEVAAAAIAGMDEDEILAFIAQFPGFEVAETLVPAVAALLLPRPISPQRKNNLLLKLVPSGSFYEWRDMVTNSPSTAARNMREMLITITQLPDFQLC